jgi:predicted small lipoprotein YifL
MRKILPLLIAVFTLSLFVSCGLKKPPQPIPKPEKAEEAIKTPKKGGYELAE